MKLRPRVRAALEAAGVAIGTGDTPGSLRERLNDVYVEEVKALKARRVAGEIAPRDYAPAALALRDRYPLLGLPLAMWEEEEEDAGIPQPRPFKARNGGPRGR